MISPQFTIRGKTPFHAKNLSVLSFAHLMKFLIQLSYGYRKRMEILIRFFIILDNALITLFKAFESTSSSSRHLVLLANEPKCTLKLSHKSKKPSLLSNSAILSSRLSRLVLALHTTSGSRLTISFINSTNALLTVVANFLYLPKFLIHPDIFSSAFEH